MRGFNNGQDLVVRSALMLLSFATAATAVWFGLDAPEPLLAIGLALFGICAAIFTTGVVGVAIYHLGVVAVIPELDISTVVLVELATVFLLISSTPPPYRIKQGLILLPVFILLGAGVIQFTESSGYLTTAFGMIVALGLSLFAIRRTISARFGFEPIESKA